MSAENEIPTSSTTKKRRKFQPTPVRSPIGISLASSSPSGEGNPSLLLENPDDGPKRRWQSSVWQHYDIFEGDRFEDGIPRAICKYCKSGPLMASSSLGTSNFKRHTDACILRPYSGEDEDEKFNPSSYKKAVALAIIRHGYPFTYVEHQGNRDVFSLLNKGYKPISRNTVKSCVMQIHENEKARLKGLMARVSGKICLTSDMWTSVVSQGYLFLTAHFIDDDWNLHAKILNFCHVEPPHSAIVLHDTVFSLLKDWGIHKKVFSITLDNAKCNDNMQDILLESLSLHSVMPCRSDYFHVRCGAHVLNLIVQDGLTVIDEGVQKLRRVVAYIVGSESRLLRFRETAISIGINCSAKLCLDCPTRWNSTFKMLNRGMAFHAVFSNMRRMERTDPNFPPPPSEEEWSRIRRICLLLKPFDDITTLISGRKYPTANLYLKSVWKIESLLLKCAIDDDPFLRDMARRMIAKFDKYWDSYSLILSFAAMLDPQYKFQFVKFCFKELDEASSEVKSTYVKDKFFKLFDEHEKLDSTTNKSNTTNQSCFDDIVGFSNFHESTVRSEVDMYLDETKLPHTQDLDILKWWKENESRFPTVAKIAKDILAIPITSVVSESAFSMGSRVLTKWRSSLSPTTANALLTTRSWLYGFHTEDEYEDNQEIEGLEFQIADLRVGEAGTSCGNVGA